MGDAAKFFVPLTCVSQILMEGRGRKDEHTLHDTTLSLSNYVNRAEMMTEVGGFLVTHHANLQSYSR